MRTEILSKKFSVDGVGHELLLGLDNGEYRVIVTKQVQSGDRYAIFVRFAEFDRVAHSVVELMGRAYPDFDFGSVWDDVVAELPGWKE